MKIIKDRIMVGNILLDQVRYQVCDKVEKYVWDQVVDQVRYQVWIHVGNQVWYQVWVQVKQSRLE